MTIHKTFFTGVAATLLLFGQPACAQVYSWKDPNSGQSKFSTVAPPWYSRTQTVNGPRVVQTQGGRVVDDTALPYEERLLLSGKSKDFVDKLRLQKNQDALARRDAGNDSARSRSETANRQSAATEPLRAESVKGKGS